MKKIKRIIAAATLAAAFSIVGASTVSAQETMLGKAGDAITNTSKKVAKKTVSGTKAVYKGGKRVGYTVGTKTWDGTKWVASKTWKGGKWIAVKTAKGTKWVYRKAVGGTKKVVS